MGCMGWTGRGSLWCGSLLSPSQGSSHIYKEPPIGCLNMTVGTSKITALTDGYLSRVNNKSSSDSTHSASLPMLF